MRRALPNVLFAVAGAAALASCGSEEAAEEPILRPVRWQQVFATGSERARSFSGTARAGVESRLSFKVGGTVQEIAVKVGDRIRAGDRMARLDPTDYDLQAQDSRASLDRYLAEARQAAANYERIRQLYENKNAARADLDAARAASEAADAAVSSGRQRVEMALLNLEYTQLTAPVDGAVSEVPVEVNENVSAGQVIAVLTSGSRPEVSATIPAALIGEVREGDAVTVAFDALSGRELPATVTEVAVSATESGAAFPVTVRLDDATEEILPGMAAEVTFRFGGGSGRTRIVVPASAVLQDRGGRFAFTVVPDESGLGTVHRRPVAVGELTAEGLEILDGLQDGELVVTAGVTRIHDGMRVKVPGAPGS